MDACIARGGISHVLSQARASLKTPSRPFTPQTSSRPLFHGDDYRPTSRPSSSFTVAELKQLAQQQTVPKRSKPPPRPIDLKARPPPRPKPLESSSTGSLKLVHAPVLSDDESGDDSPTVEADEPQETQFDPEASLSLPSNEELVQAYGGVERCFNDLLIQESDSPDFVDKVGQLRELLDNFVDLSAFLQTGGKSREEQDDTKLRRRLFDKLANVLLEKWPTNAACALELAPSLLALYCDSSDDGDRAKAQVTKLGKTLFVLSKDSSNDSCFCNVRYVEAILHAIVDTSDQASGHRDDKHSKDSDDAISLSTEQESLPLKTLIYAAGTLKNISNAEDKMARLLATNRAIAILSETMLWRSDDAATNKEIAQFLIQTTGILRNLSVSKSNQKQFLEAHIPLRLCGMIPAFIEHQELMVNISRILSKLTLHELPRAQINQRSTNLQNLMAVIDHRQNPSLSLLDQQRPDMRSQDLLFVRVFFVLGNLCAGNDQNRRLIAANLSGISILLEVLQFYSSRYSDARSSKPLDDEKEERCRVTDAEQAMEVLIKLVRVIANLAINAEVGAELNGNEGLTPLLDILDVAQQAGDEELMLNTVSCITNVSYYSSNSKKDQNDEYCFIENDRLAITRLLSRILLDRNEEAVVEAARAFGNLSRFQDVLTFMGELKVLDCLVMLLDHCNREVVYTVCGVLMNAALDPKTREGLLSVRPTGDNEGVDVRSLLGGVVECAAADDFDMTLIASKALYNLLLSKTDQGKFNADATSLRDTIEETLGRISNQVERGKMNEPNEEEDEEVADSWSSRQELRLVLPQLLRSVNSLLEE